MDRERLMKMAGSVRTGGKGSMRRKKKAVHKSSTTDDKKLQSTLKRIGVNTIPAIEEVNIFKDDLVIQFVNPKVQASVVANTWVIAGTPSNQKTARYSSRDYQPACTHSWAREQTNSCVCWSLHTLFFHLCGASLLPRPDNLDNLRKLAEQFQKEMPAGEAGAAQADDDDDVPELVAGETFEAAAEEGQKD
ncbi:hypothetical protein OIU77_021568 [Salix suchowensis]|uniref:Nascent polypeptide-associated complex subunit beta n=1 Tax=Salix suchowensis TaxID=1278906 RepID=A0ABQ9CAC9_9ROSI|nr:hypothetical protein OIU77_021568 [Salix suchowensis]KAJ6396562.1 hypothetical protein OIU77_021568 [Salix suchowensis]